MHKRIVQICLLKLGTVKADEVDKVSAAFYAFLFALAGYFVVLPLRDEAGVALGTAWLPTLFTCSLLLTSIASPAASAYLAAHPHSREQGVASLFVVFAGSMMGFLLLYGLFVVPWHELHALLPTSTKDVQAVQRPEWLSILPASVRAAFFLWLSLLNLLAVSSLWTVMADRFTAADAKRLFGVLGAGATLGQLLGSLCASASAATSLQLQHRMPLPQSWLPAAAAALPAAKLWTDTPPFLVPLLLAMLCYAMSASALRRLAAHPGTGSRHAAMGGEASEEALAAHMSKVATGSDQQISGYGRAAAAEVDPRGRQRSKGQASYQESWTQIFQHSAQVSWAAAREGVRIVWNSPYLQRVCAFMMMQYVNSSLFYFEKNLVVAAAGQSATHRTAFFAAVNSASAICIMLLQLLVTGRLIVRLGIPPALLLAPAWSVLCMVVIGLYPSQSILALVEVSRKLLLYSITRPCREVLFTVVPPHSKYKVKLLIDTIMQRLGDTCAAAMLQGLQLLRWASPRLMACTALGPLSLWALTGVLLGRQFSVLEKKGHPAGVNSTAGVTQTSCTGKVCRKGRG